MVFIKESFMGNRNRQYSCTMETNSYSLVHNLLSRTSMVDIYSIPIVLDHKNQMRRLSQPLHIHCIWCVLSIESSIIGTRNLVQVIRSVYFAKMVFLGPESTILTNYPDTDTHSITVVLDHKTNVEIEPTIAHTLHMVFIKESFMGNRNRQYSCTMETNSYSLVHNLLSRTSMVDIYSIPIVLDHKNQMRRLSQPLHIHCIWCSSYKPL